MTGPPPLPGRKRPRTGRSPGETFAALAGDERLRTVSVDAIEPNPDQPRQRFDPEALDLLAGSIAERGILQPPTVIEHEPGRYQLVAGERRWRASKLAGLREIDVLLRDRDAQSTTLEDALLENTARQDLTPVEEARAYRLLIDDLGLTISELARRIGRSRPSVSNHLRLLELPAPVLTHVETGALTFGHARALITVSDTDRIEQLAATAAVEGWSVRRLESEAKTPAPNTPPAGPKPRDTRPQSSAHPDLTTAISDHLGQPVDVTIQSHAVTMTAARPDAAKALLAALGVDPAALERDA
ncbi:MAG: ParB/RepB/Spo0J family partition protein [Solirubrobacteraceae bacterium]|nr:ParB/RepB/Spo0J family partition protein [Solirubrobacteraceae bacterium]